MSPIVELEGLNVEFGHGRRRTTVVAGVSLTLSAGECLALVGESGSGKSVTARTLVGLTAPGAAVRAERFLVEGRDAAAFGERDWRRVRGRTVGLVLQDALSALDPLRRVGAEVGEPLLAHRVLPKADVPGRVEELLAAVGVPEPAERARQYPHQLSGGLRQRALIASALAAGPRVLVADEPTTALDVTVQAQVLDLLGRLKAEGTALLLISHDLAVVARLADRIAVMKDGRIVESGPAGRVLGAPEHPYTRMLLAAAPDPDRPAPVPSPARSPADVAATVTATVTKDELLTVRGLVKRYRTPDGGLREAVAEVSFGLAPGETLGIVGESGSGKSTTARLVMGMLAPDAGEVLLDGRPWSALPERERRPARPAVQLVHQDPLASFDPRFTVRRILAEALAVAGVPRGAARRERAVGLLTQVGLGEQHLERRPHGLSGGQRQRVAIARALATGPRLLVCDEPVSALDVSVQAQVLELLARLRDELGLAMLFISHDLAVVRQVSDRVLVMKDGRAVEYGPVERVFRSPGHPYTRQLLAAVPRLPARAAAA
ncbi:dipeptide ABC transporter ATP-binding protein [Streptomyces sp. CBMA156]|uniref:dipeptide ABC transporter ATP-binding protein n=1 Tax=Streptomyces sp. CBMA156 TaxID=1930280 RepID=UPI0016619FEA|nr:ABC transporter ATP-binding protein [Streptomyces sp. CBMA156]MBD0676086.1 ABC transporter ATP-binding protein [Streptomyces sp. CBMA156]